MGIEVTSSLGAVDHLSLIVLFSYHLGGSTVLGKVVTFGTIPKVAVIERLLAS